MAPGISVNHLTAGGPNPDAVAAIAERFRRAPSPQAAIAIEQLGGAVARVSAEDTAFNHRASRFNLLILGMWTDGRAKSENVGWVQSISEILAANASSRVYVNYLGQSGDEGAGRVEAAYGPASYARLVALKNKYDPENPFRLNQNIRPAG